MTEMATFGKGNSGSNYTVDEVCHTANSADHNCSLMWLIATDGMAWSVCLCVLNGDKHCCLARIGPHNHALDGVPHPRRARGNFGGGQAWACPQSVYKGAWIFGATMRPDVKLLWPLVNIFYLLLLECKTCSLIMKFIAHIWWRDEFCSLSKFWY